MCGFFDSVHVPVDEQVVTWIALKKAHIVEVKQLANQTKADLEHLGIKPYIADLLVKGDATHFQYLPTKLDVKLPPAKKHAAAASETPPARLTKFIKGDKVEHFREADHLIRCGKIVGVHLDDLVGGPYYTIQLKDGNELQSQEHKIDFEGKSHWPPPPPPVVENKRRSLQDEDEELL